MTPAAAKTDIWPHEREGYSEVVTPAYAPAAKVESRRSYPTTAKTEERIGSIVAGIGVILLVRAVTGNLSDVMHLAMLPPGPLETCAIGILIWLHAKWRRATQVR